MSNFYFIESYAHCTVWCSVVLCLKMHTWWSNRMNCRCNETFWTTRPIPFQLGCCKWPRSLSWVFINFGIIFNSSLGVLVWLVFFFFFSFCRVSGLQAMSTNPLFATKKRDVSMLYGTSCVNANSSAEPVRVYPPCNGQISCPPSKRLRSANASKGKAMDEVFGDNEDFTADDLEEIDILASQAFTQDSSSVNLHFNRNQGKVLSDNEQSTSTFPQIHRPTPHRPERVVTSMFTWLPFEILHVHYHVLDFFFLPVHIFFFSFLIIRIRTEIQLFPKNLLNSYFINNRK